MMMMVMLFKDIEEGERWCEKSQYDHPVVDQKAHRINMREPPGRYVVRFCEGFVSKDGKKRWKRRTGQYLRRAAWSRRWSSPSILPRYCLTISLICAILANSVSRSSIEAMIVRVRAISASALRTTFPARS